MDPHQMNRLVEERKSKFPNIEASAFINLALSERLTQSPERFFSCRLQTHLRLV
jgi:hypothetical protein